ncbi:hypothetical protein ANO11243_034020 [Dothideomycetidae sp. 11243]|nr:hypothetical protein ANO11243_034020 [fungal sp. No.11243]
MISFIRGVAGSAPMLVLSAFALVRLADAHSWVEQMQEISSTGNFTGAMGYPRGYVSRTEAGFDGNSMDYLLPALMTRRTRINSDDLLCHPDQRTPNQTPGFPMLTTSPGNFISMKYLENGHVTLPQNQAGKPPGAGTVFVFGTTSPNDTETLTNVLKWTADGTGGDARGSLLAAQNFDDGRCHQLNSGTISQQRQQQFPDRLPGQPNSNVEQWCETDFQVPVEHAANQTLTLYWVWQWPTAPGVDPIVPNGKDEYYTTCSDVYVISSAAKNSVQSVAGAQEATDRFALVQQDPQVQAVASYSARTAIQPYPLGTPIPSKAHQQTNIFTETLAPETDEVTVTETAYTTVLVTVTAGASAQQAATTTTSAPSAPVPEIVFSTVYGTTLVTVSAGAGAGASPTGVSVVPVPSTRRGRLWRRM